MGHMYARNVLQIRHPRVGLLSIGEEESRATNSPATRCPCCGNAGLNFIGNVEGRDLFNGHTDVAVCDGFVGNVALKTCEGLAKLVSTLLRESAQVDGHLAGRRIALAARPSTTSRSAWTTPSTAARLCSASAASASSAMAPRTNGPS